MENSERSWKRSWKVMEFQKPRKSMNLDKGFMVSPFFAMKHHECQSNNDKLPLYIYLTAFWHYDHHNNLIVGRLAFLETEYPTP